MILSMKFSIAAMLLPISFAVTNCKKRNSKASGINQTAANEVYWEDLKQGDLFKISPSSDEGLCWLPGADGLTKQICGPYALWQVIETGEGLYKSIKSIEDGSCLTINSKGIRSIVAFTSECASDATGKHHQMIRYLDGVLEPNVSNWRTANPLELGELKFFRNYFDQTTNASAEEGDLNDLVSSALTGSSDYFPERSYVFDRRTPIIKEVAIYQSKLVPGTVSGIELVYDDLSGSMGSNIEILGHCDVGLDGHCENAKRIQFDNKTRLLSDMALKYAFPGQKGPLVGVRVYVVKDWLDSPESELVLDVDFSAEYRKYIKPKGYYSQDLHHGDQLKDRIKTYYVTDAARNMPGQTDAKCDGGVMLGMDCDYNRCDDIALYCSKPIPKQNEYWVDGLLSDENNPNWNGYQISTKKSCGEGEAITGIRCHSGDFCDNLQIRCAKIDGFNSNNASCRESEVVSEELPNVKGEWYPASDRPYLITGIKCSGGECDNKIISYCDWDASHPIEKNWIKLSESWPTDSNDPRKGRFEKFLKEYPFPILTGLSVRFTHPSMTHYAHYEYYSEQMGQRVSSHYYPYGGSIYGVGGIFALPSDPDEYNQSLIKALGSKTSPIIQAQHEAIGIYRGTKNTSLLRSDILSFQSFRFSSTYADHKQFSSLTNVWPALMRVDLCGHQRLDGMKLYYEGDSDGDPKIIVIGAVDRCSKDNGNTYVTESSETGLNIKKVEWQPGHRDGFLFIHALKLTLDNDDELTFDPGEGLGLPWEVAFEKEGYTIRGFQGYVNQSPAHLGVDNWSKTSYWTAGDDKKPLEWKFLNRNGEGDLFQAFKINDLDFYPTVFEYTKKIAPGIVGLSPIYYKPQEATSQESSEESSN